MSPAATGRYDGRDLVVSREFRAPAEDVWASVTEPERTARWFGAWRGDAGPGRTVEVQMAFEEGAPWFDLQIDACEPPHRLDVRMGDGWAIELRVTEADGVTTLTLTQCGVAPGSAPNVGPGWEYYLDMLVAARAGEPLPDFGDYFPAQAAHYGGTA